MTRSAALLRECNALRQEEIIEEIEVILLSTMRQDHSPRSAPPSVKPLALPSAPAVSIWINKL